MDNQFDPFFPDENSNMLIPNNISFQRGQSFDFQQPQFNQHDQSGLFLLDRGPFLDRGYSPDNLIQFPQDEDFGQNYNGPEEYQENQQYFAHSNLQNENEEINNQFISAIDHHQKGGVQKQIRKYKTEHQLTAITKQTKVDGKNFAKLLGTHFSNFISGSTKKSKAMEQFLQINKQKHNLRTFHNLIQDKFAKELLQFYLENHLYVDIVKGGKKPTPWDQIQSIEKFLKSIKLGQFYKEE